MKSKRRKFTLNAIKIKNLHLKHKIFAFFLLILICIILYVKMILIPIIVENTETQIQTFATKAINYAVADTVNQGNSYGELVNIVKDSNNNVSYVEANSVRINLLSKNTSKVVMKNFLELAKNPITISLGSFLGVSILAGYGPKIAYQVHPYGEVFCDFFSKFNSAGINQTYHKLYLNVMINVYVVLPFKSLKMHSESQVLLLETLIVGKIPEVYLHSSNLTDMLNLVPERFTS